MNRNAIRKLSNEHKTQVGKEVTSQQRMHRSIADALDELLILDAELVATINALLTYLRSQPSLTNKQNIPGNL